MVEHRVVASVAAGSSPVAHPIFLNSLQDNLKDKQGQGTDKASITKGPDQSGNPALHTSNGQPETFGSQIKDRNFPITTHNRPETEKPENHDRDPELAELVDAWPDLDAETRSEIIGLVRGEK